MPRTDTVREDAVALAAFLRRLADAVECDSVLAERLVSIVGESGLDLPIEARAAHHRHGGALLPAAGSTDLPPDPFALLRERGDDGLRSELARLDAPALRAIIRRHRLDPARISARWTARERLVMLIADQVRARSGHGRAFEHV
jgi:hypothetical protein